MEEAVHHAILPVAVPALGTTKSIVVGHITERETPSVVLAVGCMFDEAIDQEGIGSSLVCDEGDVVTSQGSIVLNDSESIQVIKINPSPPLIDQES